MIRVNIYGTGSDGNLSLIDDSLTAIMIDCGLSTKMIKDTSVFNRLKACIVTHQHNDHAKYKDKISEITHIINDCTSKKIDNFRVTTVEAFHNVKNIAAYIYNEVEDISIMWATDYYKISKLYNEIDYIFSEISYDDDILNEALFNKEIEYMHYKGLLNHMSLQRFCNLLKNVNLEVLKGIVVLHESDYLNRILAIDKINEITKGRCSIYFGKGEYLLTKESITQI